MMKRCYYCMSEYSDEFELCPQCGHTNEEKVENALHMFPGTILNDKYIVGRVIGYGGFGVTYLAWDTLLRTKVAIKEYLPSEFSTRAAGQTEVTVFSGDKSKQFADGMNKFVDEAKRLAKFRSENGIVKIFDCFNENGTAYIAMEYLQGETLAKRLEREKTVPVDEAIEILMPIIESLNRVHDEGIIHRDIAPDNIFLTDKGEVKLIDFGASRYATTSKSRSLTVIIKPGYSAEEQYRSRSDQGPHTDVYSVGAVLYRMITGQAPPDAMERRALFEKSGKDMLIPIKKLDKNIDRNKENAVYNALNIRISDRTPDMISLAGELMSEEPVNRRRSGIKKIDILTWPLWAKIGIPSGIVAVIALCILLAFGVIGPKSGLATDFSVPEGQVLIPNIVAESVEDAQKTLREDSLTPRIADRVSSAIIDRDLVLRQDPDALNVVNKGSIVDIIISDGKGMSLIPDVVGLTVEFATQRLNEAGFEVATEEEPSETFAKGAVISQDFEPESVVEKGTTVTLKISTGPENVDKTKQVQVPDIVGMDLEKAKKELEKYHLRAAVESEIHNNSIPDNQVVSQTPGKNNQAYQGDTVYITINKKQKLVAVIDYKGRNYEEVKKELVAAGLIVDAEYVQNKDYAPETICGQSFSNKSVPAGTKITFTVSEGYSIKVADVVGKQRSQAEDILVGQGLAVETKTEYSNTVDKDKVIRQTHANENVELGTTITLVVSLGKEPEEEEETTTEPQKIVLTSVSISSKPNRTEYYVGDRLDSSGISVVARYSDSSTRTVTSQCKIPDTRFETAGSETVTVSYEEGGISKTASFEIKVIQPSIELSNTNIKIDEGASYTISYTTYPSGLSVSWKSDNNNVATVSGGTVSGIAEGRATVTATISYGGKQFSKSATVNVYAETGNTGSTVTGIQIEKNPGKSSTYYIGDSYSIKDMKISLIKSSGAPETISSGFSVTPEKFTKAGSQTMTVKYGSYTTTFAVDVRTPSVSISQSDFTLDKGKTKSIQASPKPDKDFEIIWESSAPSSVKVAADSSSSGKMNATVTAVSSGTSTITAKIKYKGTVYASDTVNVTVKAEKVLSRIQVSGTPTNTQYIGDDFDPTGLTVKAVYSDGTSQNVTGFDCSQSNKTQATQDITVSYGGKTATYKYTFKTPTISYSFKNNKRKIDLAVENDSVTVQVFCIPDNGKWDISYSTDNSAITVGSSSGVVKGVSETTGAKVKITATYKSNYTTTLTLKDSDSIVVQNTKATINKVTLNQRTTQTYKVGDTIDRSGYYAVVEYSNGQSDNMNTEQDKLIVTFKNGSTLKSEHVEYNGRRYFATVYVKYTVDGTEYATKEFEVTVDVPTPTLSLNTNSMTIDKGDSDYVGLSISNLTFAESQYTVEWSTSSSAVSLSGNSKSGVTVKGVNSGSATVTATLKYDGSIVDSDSFTVTVEAETTTGVPTATVRVEVVGYDGNSVGTLQLKVPAGKTLSQSYLSELIRSNGYDAASVYGDVGVKAEAGMIYYVIAEL